MKLIVEMELPCKIYYLGGIHGTPTCPIERRICKDQKNPPSWCPIKCVLLDEHGDLIDRDALIEDINKQVKMLDAFGIEELSLIGKELQKGMIAEIDKQTPVIAAERK